MVQRKCILFLYIEFAEFQLSNVSSILTPILTYSFVFNFLSIQLFCDLWQKKKNVNKKQSTLQIMCAIKFSKHFQFESFCCCSVSFSISCSKWFWERTKKAIDRERERKRDKNCALVSGPSSRIYLKFRWNAYTLHLVNFITSC